MESIWLLYQIVKPNLPSGREPKEEQKMSTNKTANMYKDSKVNVKVKLALLWVALMFFYIYNDIFSLYQPGHVADLVEGQLEGVKFTQTILISAAALMAFPSFMILLSLMLNARVNRIVNIIVGVFHVLVLVGTQFVGEGETWFYWRFYELLEVMFLALIIWTAWKWPTNESQHQ
jgi:predicted tellurium resistance membrane protein TerC